jgi:hypothetical protein
VHGEERGRQRSHQIARRDDRGGSREGRDRHHHLARDARSCVCGGDVIAEVLSRHHLDAHVTKSTERAAREPLAERRVSAPGHQHDSLLEEPLDVQACALPSHAEVQIDLGGSQIAERHERVDPDDAQVRLGQLPAHRARDRRHPGDLARVGDRERERPRAARGIEGARPERLLQLADAAGDQRRELGRPRRRDDTAALARHQRVPEQVPQAGERVAHGRRRHVEPLGRARHVALGEHGVEHEHQVQIDRGDAHDG